MCVRLNQHPSDSPQAAERQESAAYSSVGEWVDFTADGVTFCPQQHLNLIHDTTTPLVHTCGAWMKRSTFTPKSHPSTFSLCVFSGLEEVVFVIQSQRNSYHARQGEQRRVEILQQAAELGQVTSGRRWLHWRTLFPRRDNTLGVEILTLIFFVLSTCACNNAGQ